MRRSSHLVPLLLLLLLATGCSSAGARDPAGLGRDERLLTVETPNDPRLRDGAPVRFAPVPGRGTHSVGRIHEVVEKVSSAQPHTFVTIRTTKQWEIWLARALQQHHRPEITVDDDGGIAIRPRFPVPEPAHR